MSDKKHIDRIFQEKLKDFEATPNPELWNKIQNELGLEKDKPKEVIPLWIRLAGIAALLALFVSIGTFVFDGENGNEFPSQNVVDTESNEKIPSDLNKQNINTVNNENVNTKTISDSDPKTLNTEVSDNLKTNSESKIVTLKTTEKESKLNTQTPTITYDLESPSQIKTTSVDNLKSINSNINTSKNEITSSKQSSNLNQDVVNTSAESSFNKTVASSSLVNNVNSNSDKRSSNSVFNDGGLDELSNENNSAQITDNSTKNKDSKFIDDSQNINDVYSGQNATNTTQTVSSSNIEVDQNAVETALGAEKTQEAVAINAMNSDTPHNEKEKEENQKVGDSLATGESPSIEEAIAQAESIIEKEEEEKLVNRWQVAANIAPVYYNSLGKGSHIDDQFVSNSKSGETNMSYGVNVSYALSKKLSVRSGINSLDLSYDTDNVILYETPSGSNGNPINPLRNINLAPQSQSLNAFSADNLGVQQISDVLYNAAISQRLSYYEVPVELEYKLVNNRFGLNLIGGVSTFFLDGNEVYSEFEEFKTYIGEANNINNVSFSTNLGIGINYKFTETFKFNLEPTFKYQLNGFENTSGNFRPYIIGVYSGFSYRF